MVISGFMLKFAAQNKICNYIEILINFKRLKNREMKKKDFAPEMEEVKIDEVVVLDNVVEPSKEKPVDCPEEDEA